jgi:hypothetical protein
MKGLLRHLDGAIVPWLGRVFTRVAGRPGRVKVLTAAGLAATAAVIVTVVVTTHAKERPRQDAVAAGSVVHVGVAQGQSIPGYVATSRNELRSLVGQAPATPVGEVYALVSFKSYLAPSRLTPVLGGVAVAEVYSRVSLPRQQTQIVRIPAVRIPDDVVSGMRQVASRKDSEADGLRDLAAKLSETNTAEVELRDGYLGDAAVAMAEAEAYRAGCTCVYAAVVRATPAALDQISASPQVRAVDPAPEVLRLDQAVFLAPLPEQQDPAPSPSGAVSPTPSPGTPSPAVSVSPQPSPSLEITPGSPQSASPSVAPSPAPTRTIEQRR